MVPAEAFLTGRMRSRNLSGPSASVDAGQGAWQEVTPTSAAAPHGNVMTPWLVQTSDRVWWLASSKPVGKPAIVWERGWSDTS